MVEHGKLRSHRQTAQLLDVCMYVPTSERYFWDLVCLLDMEEEAMIADKRGEISRAKGMAVG